MKDEFAFIEFLRKNLPRHPRDEIGVGDDSAVTTSFYNRYILLTSDSFVEGIHYESSWLTPKKIGAKAFLSSLSDIAACGGLPVGALVNLSISRDSIEKFFFEDFYAGLKKVSEEYNCPVMGGDLCIKEEGKTEVHIFILGEVEKKYLTLRSGARPGDLLFITGDLGRVKTAIEVLKKRIQVPEEIKEKCLQKFFYPEPRIKEARSLLGEIKINSMIDVSDGLVKDSNHLARESKVKVVIFENLIPIHPAITKIPGMKPLSFAIKSGEEYELLWTMKESEAKKLSEDSKKRIPVSQIGAVEEGEGVFLKKITGEVEPLTGGYNHLKKNII